MLLKKIRPILLVDVENGCNRFMEDVNRFFKNLDISTVVYAFTSNCCEPDTPHLQHEPPHNTGLHIIRAASNTPHAAANLLVYRAFALYESLIFEGLRAGIAVELVGPQNRSFREIMQGQGADLEDKAEPPTLPTSDALRCLDTPAISAPATPTSPTSPEQPVNIDTPLDLKRTLPARIWPYNDHVDDVIDDTSEFAFEDCFEQPYYPMIDDSLGAGSSNTQLPPATPPAAQKMQFMPSASNRLGTASTPVLDPPQIPRQLPRKRTNCR
ncbi:hypothetical protein HK097_010742 [Rhizophlyctis rosea]|uniref:Uncharacterized protein n=1 Tax=Rhizophlyctis rosea TaxID=64517 RepID=A0AAD5S780_9FUNG|nr:hypothetical protein HK097_010742 [Rhizophlyctis rosea]